MMSVAQRVILLSTVEYEVLWSHLELGRMPYPLAVPSTGFWPEDRAEVVNAAWDGLADRGLADASGPDEEVVHLLRLIARPRFTVDAVGHVGEPLRALAALDGDAAGVAVLTGAGLSLASLRPNALASTVVGLLPYAEPGPGQAFTFPHATLRSAIEHEEDDPLFDGDEHDALVRAGLGNQDARLLAELADNRVYGGQFGVTVWNWLRGSRSRVPTLVTWLDTDAGRYLVVREKDWVSVSPASAELIAARLDRVLATADDDR